MISRYLNRGICVFVAGATVTLAYGWHIHRVRAADRETMDLGRGVQVYLGEPKADTLAALDKAGYRATRVIPDQLFTVSDRNSIKVDAHLGFNPNLVYIEKSLDPGITPDVPSDFAFAKAIFYASQSLIDQGCKSVSMTPWSDDESGHTLRNVDLFCEGSNRRLEISASDIAVPEQYRVPPILGARQMTATLSEVLQQPK